MSRRTSIARRLALVLPTALVSLSAGGCLSLVGGEQGSVTITDFVQAASCDRSPSALFRGVLDLNSGRGYTAVLRMRTNLPATVTTQDLQLDRTRSPSYPYYGNVDSNIIGINRAYVYLEDGEQSAPAFSLLDAFAPGDNPAELGDSLPSRNLPRRSDASGVVFNEQTTLGNDSLISVQAITAPEARILATGPDGPDVNDPLATKLIVARIALEGVTSGSGYVRTNTFTVPIEVCRGCLTNVTCVAPEVPVVDPDECPLYGQDLPLVCEEP